MIRTNQVGYLPDSVKKAVFPDPCESFEVIRKADGTVAFTGKTGYPLFNEASKETVVIGDFSDLVTPGDYFVRGDGAVSYDFKISDDVYDELLAASIKMFEYQKCGVWLSESEYGAWAHKACHTAHATIYGTNERIDVTGGWHDAGDYGRYVVPASKVVADLLLAYEYGFYGTENIPKVVRVELEWMLKMQDKATGGVYHKVTPKRFCAVIMPDQEKDELIVSPISGTATADFCAVFAYAYRIYKNNVADSLFAEKCFDASKRAWKWLKKNNLPGFKNPTSVKTGEYGDLFDEDERFWAAVELYHATKEKIYHNYVIKGVEYNGIWSLGWKNVRLYGLISYLNMPQKSTDLNVRQKLLEVLDIQIEAIKHNQDRDTYGSSLGKIYRWGSNMNIANNGMLLLIGARIIGDRCLIPRALAHLHYLLGCNSMEKGYVTGFGKNTVKNPHHRPSEVVKSAVPGMLSGGPCAGQRDEYAREFLSGVAPAKCYADCFESYSTNEIAIYWNSPLVFLISGAIASFTKNINKSVKHK